MFQEYKLLSLFYSEKIVNKIIYFNNYNHTNSHLLLEASFQKFFITTFRFNNIQQQ